MQSIICPKCGEKFSLDNNDANSIFMQIKNNVFNAELTRRLESEKANLDAIFEEKLNSQKSKIKSEFDKEISNLQNNLQILQEKNENLQNQMSEKIENERLKISQENMDKIGKLQTEILNLQNELEVEKKLKNSQIDNAKLQIQNEKNAEFLAEKTDLNTQIQTLQNQIKMKQDEIDFYKDFKAKQSIKLLGESLEQHCLIEFDKLRSIFPSSVYFEKDNEVVDGTKGDFIYREVDESGVEVISIMFEMKNEADLSANKKRNDEFFDKLDKDRKKKKCEFAVLVSMLEPDNDYYNAGIVDISHKFEKMFVVRPQFFIPLISILRSANLASFKAKKELIAEKNRNIDITNFEENLNKFKTSFIYNVEQAGKRFETAICEIDKAIKNLQDTKEALIKTQEQFGRANKKLEDLTIKKLTHGNVTMKRLFANADKIDES